MAMTTHAQEIARSQRFEFGANWTRFLAVLNETRIVEAERSLQEMLGVRDLADTSFLDVGSGSGLFSLAARRLGARVRSFDYDPKSVACTAELRRRYYPDDPDWVVGEGSVLDEEYVRALGDFDIVYAWGVLHHTGDMWRALELVSRLPKRTGKLFIAIYNDQGWISRFWRLIKRAYNMAFRPLRIFFLLPALALFWGPTTLSDLLKGRPNASWKLYWRSRGMSPWWDLVDWVGGYPFEVAKPAAITTFFESLGFRLLKSKEVTGLGNNQFVFERATGTSARAGTSEVPLGKMSD
jgi:2-polyprenyl-6-hydroxyphenyl methylase/3-demethylubiquinone-9 3-methyltransferase